MLTHVKQHVTDDQAWQACNNEEAITFASDGGLKDQHGTFGWIISSATNEVLYEGAGPVDGPPESSSSTRSELCGYAAVLLFYQLLMSQWKQQPLCTYRWVCDSKAAISNATKVTDSTRSVQSQPNHADYLGIIRETATQLNQPIEPVWVRGHQKRPKEGETVSSATDIRHNDQVDKLATWYREESKKSQSTATKAHDSGSIISVFLNKIRLVSHIEDSIRYHINGYHLRQYTQYKHGWTNATWDSVDFEMFGNFYTSLSASDQVHQTKFIFDQQPVGVNRYKRARVKDPVFKLCPCCRIHTETEDHVLRCIANPKLKESVEILKKALKSSDNHPTLRLLREGICHWIENPDIDFQPEHTGFPSKFAESIPAALDDQQRIGWNAAIRGYFSINWREMAADGIYDSDTYDTSRGRHTLKVVQPALFTFQTTMWTARNSALHDENSPELCVIRDQEIAEIKDLYTNQDKIGVGDKHYCERPLETILKKNPSSRRRWIRYMHRARKRYQLVTKHQPLISSFFRKRDKPQGDPGE
jgi:hypothetical protein